MTSSMPEPDNSIEDQRLAVIEQTYPAWRIRKRPNNMWIATRVSAPSASQAAAGFQQCILQPGLDALAAALGEQLYIAQTTGHC